MKRQKLKAPFPAFGGKSRVAQLIWDRLGPVSNYVEPFFNSGAVLLLRPDLPKIETANDLDCYIANFWRAVQHDPEAVAARADGPVNEVDLHARHRYLVLSEDAAEFRRRMRTEPDYYDAKIAGWWCWGLCCWIGSGWCSVDELRDDGLPREKQPASIGGRDAKGVNGQSRKLDDRKPRIDGGEGQLGHGVHAQGEKRPKLSGGAPDSGALGTGVHANGDVDPQPMADVHEKRPRAHRAAGSSNSACNLPGVLAGDVTGAGRPQLADAYARGRGVNGNDAAGTCAQRRAWLCDWFGRLRDRLRTVRVCCGDWRRVCDSESVTTRLGLTGIFFDPPYGTLAGRNMKLYAQDSGTVAADVRRYCIERGTDPQMRIVLAGYAGEGHEELEAAGWECVAWSAQGGYGNRSEVGRANAKKERLWCSPHCQREAGLFDALEEAR